MIFVVLLYGQGKYEPHMYHYAKVLTDSREPTTPGFGQSVHLTPVRQICSVGSSKLLVIISSMGGR